MTIATADYIVMEMTDEERNWVHRLPWYSGSTVDVWYIVDRGGCVEVLPATGLECTEPSTTGFLIQGHFNTVAFDLINNGVPAYNELRYCLQ